MIEKIYEDPTPFSFFQAVRLLQRARPETVPLGESTDPSREAVRLRAHASFAFPASQIFDLRPPAPEAPDGPARMTVTFFGAFGPLGALPNPYTELVIERVRYRDNVLRDFLDLFDHRLLTLFYLAWEKYRFPVTYERSGEDRFTEILFSLTGLGTPGLRNRISIPDQALLRYAGLLRQETRPAGTIEAILHDYFGVPVEVVPLHGKWFPLEPDDVTRLGAAKSSLGQDMVAGESVFLAPSKFRVRIGPLSLPEYLSFLPGGDANRPLQDLVRLLAGLEFDFDYQLVLKAEEAPFCHLRSDSPQPPMLGWTTWTRTRDLDHDPDDVALEGDDGPFGKNGPGEGN